jgi:CRP-like cAMP-binding protein
LCFERGSLIYAQGEPGGVLFLVERGRVRLTAVSLDGRQATIALICPGMFFGESCLASEARRETAHALTDCDLVRLKKEDMELLLTTDHELAVSFVKFLLGQNRRYEDDLLDQRFSSSEGRLARVLLLLAYSNRNSQSERTITGISHETLAELIGTTRARVSSFMAKFRKMGWIDYNRREISVHPSLRDHLQELEPAFAPHTVRTR